MSWNARIKSLVRIAAPIALAALAGCAPLEPGTFIDSGGQVIHHEFVSHGDGSAKKIELFWARPSGTGPWPVIVLVHGHQVRARNGGMVYVRLGRLRRMVERGYVAAAVSQPGYGNSDGPPDYCGPFSQDAVLRAIEHLRAKTFVKDTAEAQSLPPWWRRRMPGWLR